MDFTLTLKQKTMPPRSSPIGIQLILCHIAGKVLGLPKSC